MRMRTILLGIFVVISMCVDWSNTELRNVQEFNHTKEDTNLQIQDRLKDGWPLEGKDKRCTDYEYLKSAVNGQIQCQIKCLYHKEFDCVGVLYSYVEKFTYYCALCKNDVLTDSTNGFGFYRNVEICTDGIQNHGETGVDCGGTCEACATCADGIQNQGETGIDCGGPCNACPTCTDAIHNQDETGIDCGGNCPACPSTCPSSCKCKSGQHAVDKTSNCNYWCSKSGYCGAKDAHKKGVDCRGCAGTIDSGSPSCPSSCKCSSGHKEVDESGNCNYWCSKHGYCGMKKDHVIGGIDCRKCKTGANENTESCPSSCKCKSGQHQLDKAGNCNHWCSKYGHCGEREAHKRDGVDCRGCRDHTEFCPSSCKCKSGQHAVDKTGNCNYWCSKSGYCGEKEAHKNGFDCRGCAGWQLVADKKDCEGHDKGMGMMSTIGECARKCKTIASMFAYGTNDFGKERCYDQKCKCVCEPTASAEGTCKTKAHNGYRLYRYV